MHGRSFVGKLKYIIKNQQNAQINSGLIYY